MIVITRTKTEAEGSVKYECPERNDSLGKETKKPNLQKEERSDKSLRVVVVTKRGWVVNQINQTYFLKGLRMKKSVCLMAVLGALGTCGVSVAATGADDQSIAVTFTGRVSTSTCMISVDGGSELDLGSIKKSGDEWAATDKGTLVPLVFDIANCDKNSVNGVALVKDILGQNMDQSSVNNHKLATTKKAINVHFYKDLAGTDPGLVDLKKAPVNLQGAPKKSGKVMAGYAQLKHNGTKEPLQNGELITAKAMFNLTFN